MNTVNWDEYEFHCSALGNLTTKGRAKGELMGETCKSELRKIWMQQTWNFREVISTKEMDKGNLLEKDAINMVARKYYPGKPLFKNNSLSRNGLICGTPDIKVPWAETIHDTKCSWNLRTYMASASAKLDKGYKQQLMGYAWMEGYQKCQLDYCLLSAPPEMIESERLRMAYKVGAIDQGADHTMTEAFKKLEHQLFLNMDFSRIPEEQRTTSFMFDVEDEFIDLIETNVPVWRNYLKDLKL